MKRKSKNLLVLIVLLAIIGIAVGYAALSQTLTLKGTAVLKMMIRMFILLKIQHKLYKIVLYIMMQNLL